MSGFRERGGTFAKFLSGLGTSRFDESKAKDYVSGVKKRNQKVYKSRKTFFNKEERDIKRLRANRPVSPVYGKVSASYLPKVVERVAEKAAKKAVQATIKMFLPKAKVSSTLKKRFRPSPGLLSKVEKLNCWPISERQLLINKNKKAYVARRKRYANEMKEIYDNALEPNIEEEEGEVHDDDEIHIPGDIVGSAMVKAISSEATPKRLFSEFSDNS